MSNAFTKKVATKGIIRVNQGQCVAIAIIKAAAETKNNNQYKPLEFLFTSIIEIILRKNRVGYANNLKKVLLFSPQFSYFRPILCR